MQRLLYVPHKKAQKGAQPSAGTGEQRARAWSHRVDEESGPVRINPHEYYCSQ